MRLAITNFFQQLTGVLAHHQGYCIQVLALAVTADGQVSQTELDLVKEVVRDHYQNLSFGTISNDTFWRLFNHSTAELLQLESNSERERKEKLILSYVLELDQSVRVSLCETIDLLSQRGTGTEGEKALIARINAALIPSK